VPSKERKEIHCSYTGIASLNPARGKHMRHSLLQYHVKERSCDGSVFRSNICTRFRTDSFTSQNIILNEKKKHGLQEEFRMISANLQIKTQVDLPKQSIGF
jgi:hypothetical protein